jgi:HK97 family phage major capsid protein
MNIEELLAQMQAITDLAETENRSLTDEEVTQYESLEADLAKARKTVELRARQGAYTTPNINTNPITGTAKGDEVLERAFDHYLRTGVANSDLVELRAQSVGTTTAGGFMVPDGFRQKLVDRRKAFGGLRSVAEVIETDSGNTLSWPTLDDTANEGAITAESAAIANGADLVFAEKTLGAFKYTSAGAGSNLPLRVSVELLQDSAFDVTDLVSRKLGERIARKQAKDFMTGTGTTLPFGLMVTNSDESNAGTSITYAKLNALRHDVDPEYRDNAVWIMSDDTAEKIEALVDTTGRPLLQPNANSGLGTRINPGTLLGHAVIIDQAATITASGNNYIAFGDMREGYVIRDVKDIAVVVNPYSRASFGEVEYLAWARADGTINNRNAYATLKDATP